MSFFPFDPARLLEPDMLIRLGLHLTEGGLLGIGVVFLALPPMLAAKISGFGQNNDS